jgi:hypothetical protein
MCEGSAVVECGHCESFKVVVTLFQKRANQRRAEKT